jgi:DNA repair protein RecN (Recombination protein N)
MSLRRIVLRDFVIVESLDLDLLDQGFNVLTGETGAGKSILIDACNWRWARADSGRGARRRPALRDCRRVRHARLRSALAGRAGVLVRRRHPAAASHRRPAEGRSRGWINGSAATMAQLKALADHLVDIHGQHAWQSLTRTDAVRGLLDAYAGVDTEGGIDPLDRLAPARKALEGATERQATLQQESERLAWQIGELDKLQPRPGEWEELNASTAAWPMPRSAWMPPAKRPSALDDEDSSAAALIHRALSALQAQAAPGTSLQRRHRGAAGGPGPGAGHGAQPAPVRTPHRTGPLRAGGPGSAPVAVDVAGPALPPAARRAGRAARGLERSSKASTRPWICTD